MPGKASTRDQIRPSGFIIPSNEADCWLVDSNISTPDSHEMACYCNHQEDFLHRLLEVGMGV